jgi:hypothetical protein
MLYAQAEKFASIRDREMPTVNPLAIVKLGVGNCAS